MKQETAAAMASKCEEAVDKLKLDENTYENLSVRVTYDARNGKIRAFAKATVVVYAMADNNPV